MSRPAKRLDVKRELAKAVAHFWKTRDQQKSAQGAATGKKDAGSRGSVTGGKHADGYVRLIAAIVKNAGLRDAEIRVQSKIERTLPGYFRPSKEWDVLVIVERQLVAAIEVKSQVGSFGNNFNNRIEEAVGNAADFWQAYSKGLFAPSAKPWLGYLFMLEDSPDSSSPTRRVTLPDFAVDPAFQELSCARRYEETCLRLVRERFYDCACFFTSSKINGKKGAFSEPNPELSITSFATALTARASAFAQMREG